jgi:hypothetical protein
LLVLEFFGGLPTLSCCAMRTASKEEWQIRRWGIHSGSGRVSAATPGRFAGVATFGHATI